MKQEVKILFITLFFFCAHLLFAVLNKGDRFIPFSLKGADDRIYTVKLEDGKLCLLVEEIDEKGTVQIKKSFPDAVLLDFWATWCVPCRAAMPYMQKIHEKYQPKPGQDRGGLNLFGIALDQKGSRVVKPFYTKLKITYPMLADPPGSPQAADLIQTTRDMATKYKVQEIPVVYLIDSKGTFTHVHIGFKKEEIEDLDKTVEKHISVGKS